MRLDELDGILRSTLKISDFNDISLNGVQVACCPEREITKVALAVDACQASIDAAIEEGAQLLFVPGLPALGGFVGLLLGWRLWKRLWDPRVIWDPDRKKK